MRAGVVVALLALLTTVTCAQQSTLPRWSDPQLDALTVWIQPTSAARDFLPAYVTAVRSAFAEWESVGVPIHFHFVADSVGADVRVRWVSRFTQPISGRTTWVQLDGTIIDAYILLAVHHTTGEALPVSAMRAMALHEIGHVLGLQHSGDALAIMAPLVRARELTAGDRFNALRLYLPGDR